MKKDEIPEVPGSEPSVLDWVKSLLRLNPIPIPDPRTLDEGVDDLDLEIVPAIKSEETHPTTSLAIELQETESDLEKSYQPISSRISAYQLRLPAAVFLALLAQRGLESKPENPIFLVGIYILAAFFVGWGAWAGDFKLVLPKSTKDERKAGSVRLNFLAAGVVLTAFTYFASRINEFNPLNLLLWVSALISILIAFWEGQPPFVRLWEWLQNVWRDRDLTLRIRPWHVLVTASITLIIYFRFTQLDYVPYEMWSDHAEKLWDVIDVLDGKYSIFFPRNTGREALQFYMAAATAKYLGTGISFNTLRIGTILAGLLTLPYLYLFAREFGGRYVGLAAVLFAGIAYWPNVISRIGLRFPFYPLFVAPAMYYLLRGLRFQRRNDFLLCGLAVGLGLHSYSPARVIPLAVLSGVVIYSLLLKSKGKRINALTWLIIAGVIALVIYTPLLGAATDLMDIYLGRMVTRFSSAEQALPGNPLLIFLSNLWNGLRMFAWDDGEIWVVSVPYRPALDWITGAFFHLGVVIVFIRFLRQRRWQDIFLLVLIPILMLPSTLALAFPSENPALNRASGAIVPVFTLVATSWVVFMKWIWETAGRRRIVQASAVAFPVILFILSAGLNYRLVFEDYAGPHRQSTWNTSELGAVIRGFANTIGSYETAHVIPYPHWVDTRLVGINAGNPRRDYGVWPQDLDKIPPEPDRPQLFIFKPEDEVAYEMLREIFPHGVLKHGKSEIEGRDFLLYYVFPNEGIDTESILPLE